MEETKPPFSKSLSIIAGCLILSIFIAYGYAYKRELYIETNRMLFELSPCSRAITYSIGNFDERFGIDKQTFLSLLKESSSLWSKEYGSPLFEYKEQGGEIAVNLEYDIRQETTNKLEQVHTSISSNKQEYELRKTYYENILQDHSTKKAALEQRARVYDARVQAYNQIVAYWNAKGTITKTDYQKIEEEKRYLERENLDLRRKQDELNQEVETINQAARDLNAYVKEYNLAVDTYNEIGSSLGKEFDEGEYETAFGIRNINIYQYDNRTKLLRVLAHEFGHALGIGHIQEDKNAIMYYANESNAEALTASDIQALRTICRK
jgi:predicted Zn-dependent protease